VKAKDQAGNIDATPAAATWTIDIVAPDTAITAPPTTPSNKNSGSISFSSPDSNATFECSLDGTLWTTCTSPYAYSGLADGSHVFSVKAKDLSGNIDTTPATATWAIDTAVPVSTISSKPANPSSTNSGSFSFSANEQVNFECQMDSGAFAACSSSYAFTGLGDGAHTFTVRATDLATNSASISNTWTIATITPPTIATGSLTDGFVGSTYSQTLSASGGTPNYTWSLINGTSLPAGLTLSSTGVISGKPTTSGSKTFTVQVKDAQNLTASKSLTITVQAARADLIVTGVTAPTSGTRGRSISVSATIKNQGKANAGSFTVTFYLSSASGDIMLGEKTISSLKKDNSTNVSGSFTIPASTPIGNYNVKAVVDSKAVIMETVEGNNSKLATTVTNVK
jgi:hypothetical protein